MWSAISTRPDIFTPKVIHWEAALGILPHINGTSGFGITYQRRTLANISLERFLPTQTTPVKRPTGDLCLVKQLCVEKHVYVGFLGRRNVSYFRRLKQNTLPLVML